MVRLFSFFLSIRLTTSKLPAAVLGIPRMAVFDEVRPICTDILTKIDLGLRKQSNVGQLADTDN